LQRLTDNEISFTVFRTAPSSSCHYDTAVYFKKHYLVNKANLVHNFS